MSRPDRQPPKEDTLKEVLEVERQIKAMLDAESKRARDRREQAKRDIDVACKADLAAVEQERERQLEQSARAARTEAAAIVARARAEAERIERSSDDTLEDLVWRHIAAILPEAEA